MIPIPVKIPLPQSNDPTPFVRNEWGSINVLVGPNGTGKSIFAESLKTICQNNSFVTRYLNAERLSGYEKRSGNFSGSSSFNQGFSLKRLDSIKQQSAEFDVSLDALPILKSKPDLKIKIESILSKFFGKNLILVEEEGYLKPRIFDELKKQEYDMKESESHGLKEIIMLLTIIYDDANKILIIDEPELHIHPQFQSFLLQEIRKLAGNPKETPNKKCFFLITHSPYFIDVRTIDDLKNLLVFHRNANPDFIDSLESDDEYRIKNFLPRLNTHHKQFFFATRPIFVEGYRDQFVLSLIQEKREKLLGASGTSIIDVGGKDEMEVFFRLCKKLRIDGQFICDLDAVFNGKLRQTVSKDSRCTEFLRKEGQGEDLAKRIGELEKTIDSFQEYFMEKTQNALSSYPNLKLIRDEIERNNELSTIRTIVLVGCQKFKPELIKFNSEFGKKIEDLEGRLGKINTAFSSCGVHILNEGELEHYMPNFSWNSIELSEETKSKVFEDEKNFLLTKLSKDTIISKYEKIIKILDNASQSSEVNNDLQLSYEISELIHKIQIAITRNHIHTRDDLEKSPLVDLKKYQRVFHVTDFEKNDDSFRCRFKLTQLVDPSEREIEFKNDTVPAEFKIADYLVKHN